MKSAIGTGKSIDKAIADALSQLGCSQDEVTIRVISEGGLFKKAEVELTRDNYIEEEKPKPAAEVSRKPENKKPEEKSAPKLKIHTDEVSGNRAEETPAKKPLEKTPAPKESRKETAEETGSNKERLLNFLTELSRFSNAKDIKINVSEEESCYKALISGEALSTLIGSSGETMQAIETILNIISAKNRQQNKRVFLDVGSYKQSKIERLQEQAEIAAKKVRETGEQIKLRPMTNHERRVVHAYLQTQKNIKTFSKGEDPYRCVVVAKAEEKTESKEILD